MRAGLLHPTAGVDRTVRDVETVNGQLQRALESRVAIGQAEGVLAERHDLEFGIAFARLRSHARNTGQTLAVAARAVLDGSLDPG